LRNNVDTLDNSVLTKKKELENLNSHVSSRQNQLVAIMDRYKQFAQRNQRRHRRGLLF